MQSDPVNSDLEVKFDDPANYGNERDDYEVQILVVAKESILEIQDIAKRQPSLASITFMTHEPSGLTDGE